MEKKIVIITGSNSGLGFETAKKVAQNNEYKVILACRNLEKAEAAKEKIISETNNQDVITMKLDVSSLQSVRDFANEYTSSNLGKIYALVCNAGISGVHTGLTADGYDIIFETNHLGHFLLTNLLLPYIEEKGRIIAVSSDMHNPPGKELVWKGVKELAMPDEEGSEDRRRYSYSKLCNIYFIYELDRKLRENGSKIIANVFNPGYMSDTNFAPGNHHSRFSDAMIKVMGRMGNLDKSSTALAEIITEEKYSDATGKYYDRSTNTINSSKLSYDLDNAKELWNESEKLAGLTE